MVTKLWQKICLQKKCHKNSIIMRNKSFIRTLLGITQMEMAMLLQTTRSQWAMYELGQRALPLHSQQLLAELLVHQQTNKKMSKSLPGPTEQHLIQQKQKLERLLRENEFKQSLLGHKISVLARKQEARLKLFPITDFLKNRQDAGEINAIYEGMAYKMGKTLDTNDAGILMTFELKQELLDAEKKVLESKIETIAQSLQSFPKNT
jgi:transcriptional regulator with XRE-family HTH domain